MYTHFQPNSDFKSVENSVLVISRISRVTTDWPCMLLVGPRLTTAPSLPDLPCWLPAGAVQCFDRVDLIEALHFAHQRKSAFKNATCLIHQSRLCTACVYQECFSSSTAVWLCCRIGACNRRQQQNGTERNGWPRKGQTAKESTEGDKRTQQIKYLLRSMQELGCGTTEGNNGTRKEQDFSKFIRGGRVDGSRWGRVNVTRWGSMLREWWRQV